MLRVKIPGVIDANMAGKRADVVLKTSAFVATAKCPDGC